MDITITYRGRTFEIRVEQDDPEDGGEWTESVVEIGGEWERVSWDGSGIRYASALACITDTVWSVIETVDDDAEDEGEDEDES